MASPQLGRIDVQDVLSAKALKDGGHGLVDDEAMTEGPHAVVQLEPNGRDAGRARKPLSTAFPWKGGLGDKVRKWVLTPEFQAAIQLAAGTFVVSLFTFVEQLQFGRSCLASIFLVVGMILVARDAHIGSRLAGASIIIGALWFGALIAACVISLGRAPHVAYTTFLIIFTACGLFVTTTLRVKANLGVGIISNLGFGIMLTSGQFIWPAQPLWQHTFTALLRIALVAGLGVVIAGLLVLPSLAGDDLRMKLSSILKDLGHIISEGSSHLLLRPEDGEQVLKELGESNIEAASKRALQVNLMTVEEMKDDEQIAAATTPGAQLKPKWVEEKRVPHLSDLRLKLARCREIFGMSAVEPPFLRMGGAPYNTFKWPAVMSSLDTLIMRVAAIECILELFCISPHLLLVIDTICSEELAITNPIPSRQGKDPMMLEAKSNTTVGPHLLPAFRLIFSQLAAACAIAGRAIKIDVDGKNNNLMLLFEPSWAMIEYELAGSLYTGLKLCWSQLKAGPNDFVDPTPQVRALLYLGTVGNAIMEAMAAFEKSLKAALHTPETDDAERVASPVIEAIRILRDAALSSDAVSVVRAPPDQPQPVNVMVDADMLRPKMACQEDIENAEVKRPEMASSMASFKRSMTVRPMQQKLDTHNQAEPLLESQKSAADTHAKSKIPGTHIVKASVAPAAKATEALRDKVMRYFGWAIPLLKAIFAWDVVVVFWGLLTKDIPQRFSTPKKIWKTFWTDRWFQFGMKYFLASLVVLSILLALQSNYPGTRSWNGLYINITVVVVLSEKVDTTFQKGVLRVLTTVIGAVLGFLVMLDTDVATNSFGLTVITVAFAFVVGPMTLGPLRYAIFLTLITFDGLVLCAYDNKHHGSTKNFYTRVTVTIWGVLLCLAFDLLFPWYAASSAMQEMGNSFVAAGEVMQHFFMVMSEELELGYLRGKDMDEAEKKQKQGLLRLEKGILQKRIAGPLGGVQISLEKEGVIWKSGVLAMPLIVRQTIGLMQQVLDRLAAVELMLLQKPVVSGRFSGAPWHYLHEPLQAEGLRLLERMQELCKATCQVMGEFPQRADLEALEAAIHAAHESRLQWRIAYREKLAIFIGKMNVKGPVEPLIRDRSVDDGIRYQSSMFAYSKAMDKLMLLARTIAADPWMRQRALHPHTWQTWHAWMGSYGY